MKNSSRSRRFSPCLNGLETRNLLTTFDPVMPSTAINRPPVVGLPGPLPATPMPPQLNLGSGPYVIPVLPAPTWIAK